MKDGYQVFYAKILIFRYIKKNCKTRVTSYELQVQISEIKFTNYEFKSPNYEFKSTSQNTKSTSCKIKCTSWEIKSTSQEIKSTSSSNETTSYAVNIRVKRENSESKILNFTSYFKLYCHCLASVELKPHTKVFEIFFPECGFEKCM